jgi:hypothetical protein
MPLRADDTPAAFSYNVGELIKSGRPKAQALAIAFRVRREGRKQKKKPESR